MHGRTIGLVGVWLVLLPLASVAQAPPGDGAASRIDLLRAWVEAANRHGPGVADQPLIEVSQWSGDALQLVWIDLSTVVSLVRVPAVGVFYAPDDPQPYVRPGRLPLDPLRTVPRAKRPIVYSRSEVRELREMAEDVARGGGEVALLIRGATLHADVAMLGFSAGGRADAPVSDVPTLTLFITDGRQAGLDTAASHWVMGRRLLDRVWPDGPRHVDDGSATDAAVRAWYLSVSAFRQATEQWDPWHAERSLQIFRDDADLLFLAACLHEALSSPRVQAAMRAADVPGDVYFDVGSESAELREAERLFRRVLEQNADHAEARIRLGRVLGRRGSHQEAARHLREGLAQTADRLLRFYGNLFLGAEAQALNQLEGARRAYEEAAALYPAAQSARLGLAALGGSTADRLAARQALRAVLERETASAQDDPWQGYYTSQARNVGSLVADLYQRTPRGGR